MSGSRSIPDQSTGRYLRTVVCRRRWKEICWSVGLARVAAHEHWLYGLSVIAWRLNGRERVKHIGRRRLIARVRLGGVNGHPA